MLPLLQEWKQGGDPKPDHYSSALQLCISITPHGSQSAQREAGAHVPSWQRLGEAGAAWSQSSEC